MNIYINNFLHYEFILAKVNIVGLLRVKNYDNRH